MTMTNTHRTTADCPPVLRHSSVLASVLASLQHFHAVWCQRQALKSLDADALDDIGVTRAQAEAEAKRPVWDAPQAWRR